MIKPLLVLHRGVLNPIARTMHQPLRASKIAKAPPRMEPATAIHPSVVGRTLSVVRSANASPKAIATIPVYNRAILPLWLMLHSMITSTTMCI